MIGKISAFLERRSRTALATIAVSGALSLGILDYAIGSQIHFLLLYLVPIFLASWFISREAGIALSLFSAVIWLIAHIFGGRAYSSTWIGYLNFAMRAATLTVFAITQAQLKLKLTELSQLASRDFLTGLPNGQAFYQLAAKEMDRAFGVEPMTLVCIDVTGLKWINDRLGYPAGDQLLCSIAHTIQQNVPRPDLVGRLGGTSFGVLLPSLGSDMAGIVLRRAQAALDQERRKNTQPVTFFISAVAYTKAPRTVAELMQQADAQMARIKNGKTDSLQIATVDQLPALN